MLETSSASFARTCTHTPSATDTVTVTVAIGMPRWFVCCLRSILPIEPDKGFPGLPDRVSAALRQLEGCMTDDLVQSVSSCFS